MPGNALAGASIDMTAWSLGSGRTTVFADQSPKDSYGKVTNCAVGWRAINASLDRGPYVARRTGRITNRRRWCVTAHSGWPAD